MKLWAHQQRGLDELRPLLEAGGNSVVLTSPTGGGKSLMQREVMGWGYPTALYTNRRMLFNQLAEGLDAMDIRYGRVASGHETDIRADIQLCMIPTVHRRMDRPAFEVPPARVVLVDECHNDKGKRMAKILERHAAHGASIVGFTATPVDVGHLYEHLIVAGTNSELRKCGAHLPAYTYAPSEIDIHMVRRVKVFEEEFATPEYRQAVFGSVLEHYHALNPDRGPTILFAPGVKESIWMAQQFADAGVSAAHIDGERVWLDGEDQPSTDALRDDIKRRVAEGDIQVVCNRFVLREGIDVPQLQHLIFATAFSSLCAYVQSGGRVLRTHASHDRVVVQDHGGNWHRHGSLNADRVWDVSKTDQQMVNKRADRMRQEKADGVGEPIVCPNCSAIRSRGPECHNCGHRFNRRVRNIIQADGTLKQMRGDIYRPRRISTDPQDLKDWKSTYYRCMNAKRPMTMSQTIGLYVKEHDGKYPDPSWPFMPIHMSDKSQRIKDIPPSRLVGAS